MKNLLIFSAGLFLLASCAKPLDKWNIEYPAECHEAVQMFIDHAPDNIKAQKLRIVYVDNLHSIGGRRKINGQANRVTNVIRLDTTTQSWKQAKIRLILHELGHQVLKRGHPTGVIYDDWFNMKEQYENLGLTGMPIPEFPFPVSVMNSGEKLPTDQMMRNNSTVREYYLNELFNY